MGLDRDDTIIRRRLRQKMEFLAEDIAAQEDPTDEMLQAFLEQYADRFRLEPRVSFSQVYLNRDRRGDRALSDAEALLVRLKENGDELDIGSLGDRLPLPHTYESTSESEVAKLFGSRFPQKLREPALGEWSGPVESGYGLHLVLVGERTKGRTPELAEVRDEVLREWRVSRREETNNELYERLRDNYQVIVELPEWADSKPETAELR